MCCLLRLWSSFPWRCSTHQKVLLPSPVKDLQRSIFWSLKHSQTHLQLKMQEETPKARFVFILVWDKFRRKLSHPGQHGKSRIPGHSLPLKYLTMPLALQEKLWKVLFHSTQKQTTKQMDYRTVKYPATVLLISTYLCLTTQILWGQSAR